MNDEIIRLLREALRYEEIELVNKYKIFLKEVKDSNIDSEMNSEIMKFVEDMINESSEHGEMISKIIKSLEEGQT